MTGGRSCGLLPWWRARHRFLPATEYLDDAHGSAAAWAGFTQRERGDVCLSVLDICLLRWLDAEQCADSGEVRFAATTGQKAIVTDAVEPVGQDVDQKAADELGRGQAHDLLAIPILDAVIFPAEGDGFGISADQAVVRDGDAVRIAAQVGKHGLWAAKGWFGIDHPFGFAEWREPGGKGIRLCQSFEIAVEGQLPRGMKRQQSIEEQPPKQARQYADMQEKPGFASNPLGAVGRQAAAWHDHVDVRMVGHCSPPSVQDAGQTHLRTHALGIGGDGHHRFGRGFEQQPVDRLLVPIGDLRNLGREREDDVEILHRQQVFGAGLHPVARGRPMTLGAVPVLTTVIGDVIVAALGATGHMPAERLGPAGFDR